MRVYQEIQCCLVMPLSSFGRSANILNGKTPLTSVVLQTTGSTQLTLRHPRTPGQKLQGPAAVVLCQLLGILGVDPDSFSSSDPSAFKSMAGHPGVEAHLKARQGTLFPLPTGLCFLESVSLTEERKWRALICSHFSACTFSPLQPAMFLPLADVASMELARVGGTAATFDVYVHLKSGAVHEFAAISRDEAGPMESALEKKRAAAWSQEHAAFVSKDASLLASQTSCMHARFRPRRQSQRRSLAPRARATTKTRTGLPRTRTTKTR